MAAKILAILEQRDGLLKRSAFETVQQASQLAKDLSLEAEAVIVGGDVENLNEISKYGITPPQVILLQLVIMQKKLTPIT